MDPTPPSPPLELGALGKIANFLLFTAGVSAIFAGAQVWTVVIFRYDWQQALPVLQALTGLFATWLCLHVGYPRRWAAFAALVVLGALGCLGLPWAGWLMANGLFTALSVFAPAWAALGVVFLLLSLPGLLRAARGRAEADAETARLAREAALAGYGYGHPPTSRHGPWVLGALYLAVALPFAALALAIGWPEQWARLEARVSGVLAGRNPFGNAFVEHSAAYPYSGSPLEWYLDYEGRFLPVDRELVLRMADDIAADVGWRLSAATGEADPVAAEAVLWAEGRQKELPLWIADNLRSRGVFYHVESLFSRSFDPEVHAIGGLGVHLDCDQLAFLYLHVARRLDLAMKVIPSVFHVYVRYDSPLGTGEPLTIETTQFRSIDVKGDTVDYAGETLGESYFPDADYYSSGRAGTWASPEVVAAAGLYEPWSEEDIRDSIVANVLVGLERAGVDRYPDEAEAHLAGTRSVTLVSNLYRWYTRAAEGALDRGELAQAETYALRARQLRKDHGALVIYGRAPEEDVLATLDVNREPPPTP